VNCLDKFNKRMNFSGENFNKELAISSRNYLHETFRKDLSYQKGVYFWELGKLKPRDYIDNKPIDIKIYKRTYSSANGYTAKFMTEISTPIIVGDTLYDSVNNEFYLCTESFNVDDIAYRGELTLCNWILKWQNIDGDILEYPIYIINTTQYNSGETANRIFTLGTSQYMILITTDENTIKLESPRRFMIDFNKENPTTYIITQNDNTSFHIGKKGLSRITVMQHERDMDKDNLELGICDYFEPKKKSKDIEKDEQNTITAMIEYETNIIKDGGDSQVFYAKFFDKSSQEVTDIKPKWDIICDFKEYLDIEEIDNEIWIGIDNSDYVDEEFKLILSSESDFCNPSTLLVKVESLL